MAVGWETGQQLLARAVVTRFPSILWDLAKISRTSGLPCLASLDLTSPPFLPQVVEVEGFFFLRPLLAGAWAGQGLYKRVDVFILGLHRG